MKVAANNALCQGHGICNGVASDIFPLDDDGYVDGEMFDVPQGSEQLARRAVAECPAYVLRIVVEG